MLSKRELLHAKDLYGEYLMLKEKKKVLESRRSGKGVTCDESGKTNNTGDVTGILALQIINCDKRMESIMREIKRVRRELHKIPDKTAMKAIIWRYCADKPLKEIAIDLKIHRNTIYKKMKRYLAD